MLLSLTVSDDAICRSSCGACCIAPSIQSAIPGMPDGKPAGVACINLDEFFACRLFGKPERPALCEQFLAEPSICGNSREEAIDIINVLERSTL